MLRLARTAVRILRLADVADRGKLWRAIALMAAGFLSTPLVAMAVAALTDLVVASDGGPVVWLAVAVAVLLVGELMLGHFAHLSYFEVGEKTETELNRQLLATTGERASLQQWENPSFADEVTLVREELADSRTALESVLQLACLLAQLTITSVLLATVDPYLALLAPAALPSVVLAGRARDVVEAARKATAQSTRRSRHLLALGTRSATVKEIRLFQAEEAVLREQELAWAATSDGLRPAHLHSAALRALGQLVFAAAYAAAVTVTVWRARSGHATVGDVVLVVTLAGQVSGQVANGVTLITVLQRAVRTLDRLDSLRDADHDGPDAAPAVARPVHLPERLRDGIRFENVTFVYPGTDKAVLRDFSLHIPAGTTIALVGENGSGKSTLMKLLCGLYHPTSGRILVDGTDLRTMAPERWRRRVAPLFQDYARFELLLRENVGLGDLAHVHDDDALRARMAAADGDRILRAVPDGLDSLLGKGYGPGTELSGGQWQTLALARTLMCPDPLLMILDEPASALDAAAEHAIFDRFSRARHHRRQAGAVTLFISHRFSTVRAADLIVVLRDGRAVEVGDHTRLMHNNHVYAQLYSMQEQLYT